MFIESIAVALLIGVLAGGRFFNLRTLSLKHIELFLLPFLIQWGLNYAAAQEVSWVGEVKGFIHAGSYLLLFGGLFLNRNLPGMKILGLGVLLNFLVIAANQGLMPVNGDYLPAEVLEGLRNGTDGTHGLMGEGTKLAWLGDQIYCPLPYAKQMISVGDLVIDIGAFFMVFVTVKKGGSNFKFTYINR